MVVQCSCHFLIWTYILAVRSGWPCERRCTRVPYVECSHSTSSVLHALLSFKTLVRECNPLNKAWRTYPLLQMSRPGSTNLLKCVLRVLSSFNTFANHIVDNCLVPTELTSRSMISVHSPLYSNILHPMGPPVGWAGEWANIIYIQYYFLSLVQYL